MKCFHCLENFHDQPEQQPIQADADGGWIVLYTKCPACERLNMSLMCGQAAFDQFKRFTGIRNVESSYLIRPKGSANRPPCPPEVPPDLASDYREACLVIGDSPKASAALSRRCLQHLLRETARVKPSNLATEIQEVIDSGMLPSHLAEVIDAVRNIGNFSAHPLKSDQSGEIVPVEPQEAEWNLDVLEALFDFFFVQPEKTRKKREALNKKLKGAGKPPMK